MFARRVSTDRHATLKALGLSAGIALSGLGFACASGPPIKQDTVSAVEIRGGDLANEPELRKGLATHDDDVLDGDVLSKDLERILRFYRARGHYEASIRAARVVRESPHQVRVEIDVTPGAPVLISQLEIIGLGSLPPGLARNTKNAIGLRVGGQLVEQQLHDDARGIERTLADEGFAFVKVVERAEVEIAKRTARVVYRLTPGPRAVYGAITLEGQESLDADVMRATLALERGDRYSKRELEVAKRRLFGLGVFSTVEVKPNLEHPENPEVPVRVTVAVSTTRAVHLGAVAEQDSVLALIGVRGGWESRNFLGGLRHFTANVTPSIIFYPLATSGVALKALPSVASSFRLEQPTLFDSRTTGFVETGLSVYPVLYSDFNPGDNIIGFQEVKGAVGAERPFASDKLRVRPSYNAQLSFPFMYLGDKPEGLDTLLILYPELVGEADFRDDPIEPRAGAYFRLSAQVAGYLAGDANDVRLQPEARFYAKLGRSASLGYRGELGFLLPQRCDGGSTRGCYGDSLTLASTAPATDPRVVRDQQILLFRGFYSGGSTSNRGYSLREVGPHGILGFLVPSNVNCSVPEPPDSCWRPLGGLTMWEQSLELRFILSELAGLVFFLDASDVTRESVNFRLNFPHLAAGSGFRLRTPVGAARFDLGVRVPYMQEVGQPRLPESEGEPDTIFGAPLAFHFGLGEAF